MCKSWFSHFDYFGNPWNSEWENEGGDRSGPDGHLEVVPQYTPIRNVNTQKYSPHSHPPPSSRAVSSSSDCLTIQPQPRAASFMYFTVNIPRVLLCTRFSARELGIQNWTRHTFSREDSAAFQEITSSLWPCPIAHSTHFNLGSGLTYLNWITQNGA